MSCNGCRVLRKGCSDTCVLRHCLRCIDSPEAQAHATLFVTKFFGRAGLTGFINGVPENQRPALFQSLLYEACGRTVNPVYGAVGLLFSGNWAVCQAAVETVLRGGSPKPISTLPSTTVIPSNSQSALDGTAGSVSTLEPAGITKPNDSGFHMQCQPLPTTDQSFVTSACSSLKATSYHANPNHLLDFSNYSGSSRADQDMATVVPPFLNKRIWDWKSDQSANADKDTMFKRPRSSLSFCAAADRIHDATQMAAGNRPSIRSWVMGYKNVYKKGCSQGGCEAADEDANQVASRGHDDTSRGQLGYVQHVVAPVARRVYKPPQMKQLLIEAEKDDRNEGLHSVNIPSRVAKDDHQASMLRKGDDEAHMVSQMESMISCDGGDDESGDAITKLDLALKSHTSPAAVCYIQRELNRVQHEDPHELLRVSSPSVNSEGSVNTTFHVTGGLNMRSSCFAIESPKEGALKLLNLLL